MVPSSGMCRGLPARDGCYVAPMLPSPTHQWLPGPGLGAGLQAPHTRAGPGTAAFRLCGFGQITHPLWALTPAPSIPLTQPEGTGRECDLPVRSSLPGGAPPPDCHPGAAAVPPDELWAGTEHRELVFQVGPGDGN